MKPQAPSTKFIFLSLIIIPVIVLMIAGVSLIALEKRLHDDEYKILGTNSLVQIGSANLNEYHLKKVLGDYVQKSSDNTEFFIRVKRVTHFIGTILIILCTCILIGAAWIYKTIKNSQTQTNSRADQKIKTLS
jgi:peptidoglycan biosynthesis protein MviN/MurJ (putative lipid II flippase)